MAACGEPGEDAALFDTARAVGLELCPALGIGIPVGKDSLSMRTRWSSGDTPRQVTAPVSLVVTAFATLDDVRGTLTPQLQPGDTTLVLVDLGQGRQRLAGSMLAQVLGQFGCDVSDGVPDLDDAQQLKALVAAINVLRAQGQLLAYHDRSDGGLWATVCEMAFAGHLGATAGFAQPAGCGGATHAARVAASPPRGEASGQLASLGYHPLLRTNCFPLIPWPRQKPGSFT